MSLTPDREDRSRRPDRAPLTLPIDQHIDAIVGRVRTHRAAVVVAAPGAGKTTRVPPALAEDGAALVLQPRRVAARAIAARIATEQGWTLGEQVGWHVRFERRFSARTRVLLATEGILTARLVQDPLLSDFTTIVLDEFHERSIHADIGFALARQAWRARDDLRIVVMSATIDPRPVSAFLDGCPIIDVPALTHAVEIEYAPGESVTRAIEVTLPRTTGTILCFLPGAPEIRREMTAIARVLPALDVLPLHGSLTADEQDRAIQPPPSMSSSTLSSAVDRRRVILATNIAETSLTVPAVHAVIDTGLQKVARYDAERAIDSLELERVSQDSADQRAGRAGRLGPGLARRLWDARDRLRPQREPDIARIDLAAAVMDLYAWGIDDVAKFEWYEPPPADALDAAWELLRRLGAIRRDGDPVRDTLTPLGRALQRLPLHPRLGRILLAADGSRDAARACALLAERHYIAPRHEATSCDLLVAIDRWHDVPPHVQRVARELENLAARASSGSEPRDDDGARTNHPASERRAYTKREAITADARDSAAAGPAAVLDATALRRAIFAGYPDRVAMRRAPGSPRVVLSSSGHGAVISDESGVRDGEFLVALDVQAATSQGASEARIRIASVVDREWLTDTTTTTVHRFDAASGRVKAAREARYGQLLVAEHPIEPDPSTAPTLLAEAYVARGPSDRDRQVLGRLRFAGRDVDFTTLVDRASSRARTLDEIDIAAHLAHDEVRDLATLAPERLRVPSGRDVALAYHEDGSVSAAVKLQELFGLAETPRIGANRTPVVLHLLAPNGRPVQTTRDLRSFWDRTYPEVRKELRGRYPKHPWPEDPWSATPTARAKPRPRR